MLKVKYIIVVENGIEMPLVFSELMTHANVAHPYHDRVVSAGFCYSQDDQWTCYGDSFSLKIKSRPEDSTILTKFLAPKE
jgi:hypothetical protein